MPWVGFKPTITASERAKTVHALDRAATMIGFGDIFPHKCELIAMTTKFLGLVTLIFSAINKSSLNNLQINLVASDSDRSERNSNSEHYDLEIYWAAGSDRDLSTNGNPALRLIMTEATSEPLTSRHAYPFRCSASARAVVLYLAARFRGSTSDTHRPLSASSGS
jgi:hypothetical protein